MTPRPIVVFLHGIGSPRGMRWLDPLNRALTDQGHPPVSPDDVIAPDYRSILAGGAAGPDDQPWPVTWQRPAKPAWDEARRSFWRRQRDLSSRLDHFDSGRSWAFAWLPEAGVDALTDTLPAVEEARRYRDHPRVRAAVLRTVLEALPDSGSVLLIGHSLGSVVARDVLKRLPGGLEVLGVVTIGSPLGSVATLRAIEDLAPFPYDRVQAWVNVYEPRDVVTGGRGLSRHLPEVIDLCIALPNLRLAASDTPIPAVGEHSAPRYLRHPTTAAAVGALLHGRSLERSRHADEAHEQVIPLLTQALFARELQAALPRQSGRLYDRLDNARIEQAQAVAELSARLPSGRVLTADEVLRSCDRLVQGTLTATGLTLVGAVLVGTNPIPPFEVDRALDARALRVALRNTLQRLAGEADADSADRISATIMDGRNRARSLFKPPSPALPRVVALMGVLTLAATGVGLVAAVPAGLYGAAAIVSTLVAFGPGGMAGGVATIALLTGISGALTAGGTAAAVHSGHAREPVDLPQLEMLIKALDSMDAEAATALMLILIDYTYSAERLGEASPRQPFLVATARALDSTRASLARSLEISPRGQAVKALRGKVRVLEIALDWFTGTTDTSAEGGRVRRSLGAFDGALNGRRPKVARRELERVVR